MTPRGLLTRTQACLPPDLTRPPHRERRSQTGTRGSLHSQLHRRRRRPKFWARVVVCRRIRLLGVSASTVNSRGYMEHVLRLPCGGAGGRSFKSNGGKEGGCVKCENGETESSHTSLPPAPPSPVLRRGEFPPNVFTLRTHRQGTDEKKKLKISSANFGSLL